GYAFCYVNILPRLFTKQEKKAFSTPKGRTDKPLFPIIGPDKAQDLIWPYLYPPLLIVRKRLPEPEDFPSGGGINWH
ncbi:MAG: hypothetical protein AAB048_03040, partial [Planctomycetota bacterium]